MAAIKSYAFSKAINTRTSLTSNYTLCASCGGRCWSCDGWWRSLLYGFGINNKAAKFAFLCSSLQNRYHITFTHDLIEPQRKINDNTATPKNNRKRPLEIAPVQEYRCQEGLIGLVNHVFVLEFNADPRFGEVLSIPRWQMSLLKLVAH